ncbi:MAG: NAD(P)-dependent oxidoreductase, partial [Alphaproteobacteria bacterium]
MDPFRVAISGDFQKPDGSPAYPDFDLSPLDQHPNVEYAYVGARDGVIQAADMAGFDALILLVYRFARESFPGDDRLAMVARFGVGYDNVDVDACNDNDVALVITPDGVRRPVAVAIMTLMFALTGKLIVKDRLARSGPDGWAQRAGHMGVGVVGLTLGSVGIGNIGAEMFRLAKPFDMRFIAHDPYVDPKIAKELGVELVGLDDVFRQADIVTVNCPLNEETEHLVNAERLALMKPTAFLINTARGPIVDQAALTEVLADKRIAGAGLDVFAEEPSSADDPLFKLDNVVVTPHSLCWTNQCFGGIGAADVKAVLDLVEGRVPTGIVNREITESAAWRAKLDGYRTRYG